jgi:hypothetical protein
VDLPNPSCNKGKIQFMIIPNYCKRKKAKIRKSRLKNENIFSFKYHWNA